MATPTLDPYKPIPPIKGQKVNLRFSSASPFTPTYVLAHSPSNSSAYTTRIQGRQILFENPAKESSSKREHDARSARQKRDGARCKAGVISRRDAKRLGVWKLDKSIAKYDTFLPIHHLWCSYMAELLGLPNALGGSVPGANSQLKMPNALIMQGRLVKADFHGCIIHVEQSLNPSLVGCNGIIIHETENTFKVVTQKNAFKVIPKQNSIFFFEIPLYAPPPLELSTLRPTPATAPTPGTTLDTIPPPSEPPEFLASKGPMIRFQLYGNHFRFRSTDRATRKFKPKETIEL